MGDEIGVVEMFYNRTAAAIGHINLGMKGQYWPQVKTLMQGML